MVGFVTARSGAWSKEFFQRLSGLMVRVALPIYFFTRVIQSNPDDIRKSLLFPIVAVLVTAINLTCSALIFRFFPQFQHLKRVGLALSTFGNTGMIPLTLIELFPLTIPIIGEHFGTTAPSLYVGTYLLVGSPLLWSVGNFLVVGKGRIPGVRELFTPPLFGIAGGLAIVILGLQPGLYNPQWPLYYLMKGLERFGMVTYPTILICLGAMIGHLQITQAERRQLVSFAALISAIRFLLIPFIFVLVYWGILQRLPLSPAQKWVIFLEMHIPPASNLSMMAAQTGMNEDLVSFTTVITYIVYLVVLPVHVLLFLMLMGIA